MRIKYPLLLLVVLLLYTGCKEEALPKPKAMLRLEYPNSVYKVIDTKYFQFKKNVLSNYEQKNNKALTLDYPKLKGSLFITYKEVDNNIDKLLIDAQRLSIEHSAKADGILPYPFVNEDDKVYGMFFEVIGDAASQAQFYVTDSTKHFVTGSLYFYSKPNYDSIYPAASYLQNDIKKFMESIRWKE
ncbi:MAG: gliding motility lipoprotein GldD [Maribacter sp.]|nr:gliding motility lipoprotein GldD [Maribacter sp.]MBT8302779.1 gliding motility lipoprotein GldD [Maribacter sp.]